MSNERTSDPLRLVLRSTEEQLDDRVETVSDAKPSHQESTSELIQLEETLSSAQQKAKQLVTLRRKIESEEGGAEQGGTPSTASLAQSSDPPAPAP
jgi:hypothetical protein